MQWLIASAALVLFVILAFRFAESRKAILATLAILALLGAAGGGLLYVENRQSAKHVRLARDLVKREEIDITDAAFAYEYGRWHLRGTLVNQSAYRITGLTVHLSVADCSARSPCESVGEADAATDGIDVPPLGTQRLDLIVPLPDMPTPRAIKWDYTVSEVRAGRE